MGNKLKLAAAALIAVACIWFIVHQATRQGAVRPETDERQPTPKPTALTPKRADANTTVTVRRRPRVTPPHIVMPVTQPAATATPTSAELRTIEERARAAVAQVGVNDEAETAWLAAVNNKNVPANTRAELIYALAEEGYSDPDEFTEDDLPLIAARIVLIERVGAEAIDQTNAAAFNAVHATLAALTQQLMTQTDNNQQ